MYRCRFRVGGLMLLALLLTTVGCGQQQGEEDAVSQEAEGPPLVVAILPYTSPSDIAQRFRPLADYLESGLGRSVELHFSRDYAEPLRLLANGQADMAYLGAPEVVRLERRHPDSENLRLIAVESPYRTAVVVREGTPWRDMADLRGRTFAFGFPRSLASYFVPRMLLAEAGLDLADLADYEYLQRQERIVLSILHGDYDAGAVSEGVARQYMARHPGLRVLVHSRPLPAPAFVAGPAMDGETEAQVRELLVGPQERLGGLEETSIPNYLPDFHRPERSDYDEVAAIILRVERPCPESAR